jgi:phosphatidylglycerophosphatase A
MSLLQFDRLAVLEVGKNVNFFDKIALTVAVWFGIGLLPGVPGTFGTAGAIPLYLLTDTFSAGYQALCLVIVITGAIWSSHRAQRLLRRADSREIVIDEVAGFFVTTMFLPATWPTLAGGFFLFRFFDILKPPPIRKIEREVHGGLGVVLDDLAAGLYAHISLRLLLSIFT